MKARKARRAGKTGKKVKSEKLKVRSRIPPPGNEWGKGQRKEQ